MSLHKHKIIKSNSREAEGEFVKDMLRIMDIARAHSNDRKTQLELMGSAFSSSLIHSLDLDIPHATLMLGVITIMDDMKACAIELLQKSIEERKSHES